MTEDARSIGKCERHDHNVAHFSSTHIATDIFDNTDCFVSHWSWFIARLHQVVRPQIAAADARALDPDDRVGWLDQSRIRNVFDPDISSAVHDCRSHFYLSD